MNKQNTGADELVPERAKRRDRKKKKKMKVSGGEVKKLQKLIKDKK
jgi:hypothetical protein